jgi:hypothetical protein
MCTKIWTENLKGSNHLEGNDERIILKEIVRETGWEGIH